MTKVFSALAVSADGYITGPDPSPDQPLGSGGGRLFDWYGSGDKDVALMGSGMIAAALNEGLLDEVILHQVPVLLGGGTPYFGELAASVPLTRLEMVAAPDVTHLRFAVAR